MEANLLDHKFFKILSLDGGGSWDILQLLTLKERYGGETNGHKVLLEFDLVIANSGGSIVLAALAEDYTLNKAIELFDIEENRMKIFSTNSFLDTIFPVFITRIFGVGPKYSSKKKGDSLKEFFPKCSRMSMDALSEMITNEIGKKIRIVVTTYDALNNRAKFFRSYPRPGETSEFLTLTRAIHGSSNAPIQYFDFPVRVKASNGMYYELWDGALGGFNNPIVAGVIEALELKVNINKIKIISIGNGNSIMSMSEKENFYKYKSISQKERRKKIMFWRYIYQLKYFAKTVLYQTKTILFHPPDWANYVALQFLKISTEGVLEDRFIRLSPLIHLEDGTENLRLKRLIEALYNLDMDLTDQADIDLIKNCFQEWKNGNIKNQPIQYSIQGKNQISLVFGSHTFSDGMLKWINI